MINYLIVGGLGVVIGAALTAFIFGMIETETNSCCRNCGGAVYCGDPDCEKLG